MTDGRLHVATRRVHHAAPVREGLVVAVENLVGNVRLEAAKGSEFEIEGLLHAGAKSPEAAARLLESLDMAVRPEGSHLIASVTYPVDEHDTFRYPAAAPAWRDVVSLTALTYHGREVTVETTEEGRGVALWADLVLRLPVGLGAAARNLVGAIEGRGLANPLAIDSAAGTVAFSGCSQNLLVDTGSAGVAVQDHVGEVRVSAGSGAVVVNRQNGDVDVETGSGAVHLSNVDATSVKAETGSGQIALEGVRGTLDLETGSGRIVGTRLEPAGRLEAETGSGNVSLVVDVSGLEELRIDTGSGSVDLRLAHLSGMDLTVDTSSGRIDVKLPLLTVLKRTDDRLEAVVGEGGPHVTIDTTSGNVHVGPA